MSSQQVQRFFSFNKSSQKSTDDDIIETKKEKEIPFQFLNYKPISPPPPKKNDKQKTTLQTIIIEKLTLNIYWQFWG